MTDHPAQGPLLLAALDVRPAPRMLKLRLAGSTHREAVTRELNRLSKFGIIEQRKARPFLIKDLDRLSTLVQDAVGE